jgi:hypothetical protein
MFLVVSVDSRLLSVAETLRTIGPAGRRPQNQFIQLNTKKTSGNLVSRLRLGK